MGDTWEDLQALKNKRNSYRENLLKRRLERENILKGSVGSIVSDVKPEENEEKVEEIVPKKPKFDLFTPDPSVRPDFADASEIDLELEIVLLETLADVNLDFPMESTKLPSLVQKRGYKGSVSNMVINHLMVKFSLQRSIVIEDCPQKNVKSILSVDHEKLDAFVRSLRPTAILPPDTTGAEPVKGSRNRLTGRNNSGSALQDSVESLLALPSAKEKETKKLGGEILELLSRPTAKEKSLVDQFRSANGSQVQEFCAHGTKEDCIKVSENRKPCGKLHFRKIIQKHTDMSLGDCSFLNTCFHMNTCKYIHYEVDYSTRQRKVSGMEATPSKSDLGAPTILYPPQWIQCDLRTFDLNLLGKCAVVMADPPWDIHMELPYGTMSDDEMRQLNIQCLADEGLIFLWVTGRAMELGRECLKIWGYEQCDEIIWVKTNQLQRIIRTGRTGHWLNHGKEHCLIGIKGSLSKYNRGLDCDVIVAEVRATSHKPDEIYGIIERLSPGTKKVELFGRPHNVQPNWITLGNQLDGTRLLDPDVVQRFKTAYPDGSALKPSTAELNAAANSK